MNLNNMRSASYLLPDPGGEVVRTLIHEIDRLRAAIDEHNDEVTKSCEWQQSRNHECDAYMRRGGFCPDCPKEWLIDQAERREPQ